MARKLRMLDLFAGLGGASSAMKQLGWQVDTLDVGPFPLTWQQDIRTFHPRTDYYDFVWASPPCTEFSRESMPWCRTGNAPDMSLVHEALRVVEEAQPTYWALENVRGSLKYIVPVLGRWRAHIGPVFLWGRFPQAHWPDIKHYKQKYSGREPEKRSKIPVEISLALALAIEDEEAERERLQRMLKNRRRAV